MMQSGVKGHQCLIRMAAPVEGMIDVSWGLFLVIWLKNIFP